MCRKQMSQRIRTSIAIFMLKVCVCIYVCVCLLLFTHRNVYLIHSMYCYTMANTKAERLLLLWILVYYFIRFGIALVYYNLAPTAENGHQILVYTNDVIKHRCSIIIAETKIMMLRNKKEMNSYAFSLIKCILGN